ncbi:MAG: helix-turn-helix transcriptional regulator [Oscillibacter sp.]
MKLSDKMVGLRRSQGLSQEELAEKLRVSRQAVSRWEMGSAMPDAANILQISKLFGVTTDYLLHDTWESGDDLPKIPVPREDGSRQLLIFLISLEGMLLLMQFMTTCLLQNVFFACLSFALFGALIGGFEYAHRKKGSENTRATARFRKRFYKISAYLGLYFPIRFLGMLLLTLASRPYSGVVFECVVLVLYMGTALFVNLSLEEAYLLGEKSA